MADDGQQISFLELVGYALDDAFPGVPDELLRDDPPKPTSAQQARTLRLEAWRPGGYMEQVCVNALILERMIFEKMIAPLKAEVEAYMIELDRRLARYNVRYLLRRSKKGNKHGNRRTRRKTTTRRRRLI